MCLGLGTSTADAHISVVAELRRITGQTPSLLENALLRLGEVSSRLRLLDVPSPSCQGDCDEPKKKQGAVSGAMRRARLRGEGGKDAKESLTCLEFGTPTMQAKIGEYDGEGSPESELCARAAASSSLRRCSDASRKAPRARPDSPTTPARTPLVDEDPTALWNSMLSSASVGEYRRLFGTPARPSRPKKTGVRAGPKLVAQ